MCMLCALTLIISLQIRTLYCSRDDVQSQLPVSDTSIHLREYNTNSKFRYQAIGDNDFADRSERAAFNALPTMLTSDWWAHQVY